MLDIFLKLFSQKKNLEYATNIILKKHTILHEWINILFGFSNMESRSTQAPETSAAVVISLTPRHSKSLAGDNESDKFAFTRSQ